VLQHGLALGLALAVAAAIYFSSREIPLPDPARVEEPIKIGQPIQVASDAPPFTAPIDHVTYVITPRARYELTGVVVSYHRGDALFNMYHTDDPGNVQDVCVVWGDNVRNGSYRRVTYSSGEFTCYFQWSGSLDPPFDPAQMSNNHLIPGDAFVASRIKQLRIGDQIRMSGLLVDYEVSRGGDHRLARRTSLTRTDTGNGACEVVYVTALDVIRPGDRLAASAAGYAWYASLGLLAALGVVWFVRPPTA